MFLSYARSSEAQATYAELALRSAGYVVWRDTELPAHLSYADVIEERLKSAKAVLVLWSAEGAKSQWVRAEADAAREMGTLIQSTVDGTVPPIPFNQIQCADLTGWSGNNDHAGWRKLQASVVALAGAVEEPAKTRKQQRPTNSICVLPFQNMSSEAVPDYFCDGIAEDILTELSKVPGLAVVPRKKAFKFKGPEVDPCNVAENLGVGYVLEGSVRRAGDKVRITAQLVHGASGEHLWSDRYYRDFIDIFSIQDEIAQAIVDALKVKLRAPEEAPVEKPEAVNGAAHPEPTVLAETVVAKEPKPAIQPKAPIVAVPEPEVEQQQAEVPVADFAPDEPEAQPETYPEETYAEEVWASEEYWEDDQVEERRSFLPSEPAIRLIGLGLVLLLIGALVWTTLWPDRAPSPPQEEKLTYTITSSVNVRSLPMLRGSRILGELEKGDTINIVPTLAGAQPDWVKIQDGPYVGGYVWRESTRPASENEASSGSGDAPTEQKAAH